MYPPVMDLTSPHVQHWNDSQMFWIIQNGVRLTGMASWKGAISADDTWKLVIFIHDLPELDSAEAGECQDQEPPAKTPEQLIAYGKTLYRQEGCFICHQLDGEGTKVGPDLTVEGTRGRSAAWLIGHFKNPAAYVPGSIMPSFKNLTDEQLSALTAFLESQKGGGEITGNDRGMPPFDGLRNIMPPAAALFFRRTRLDGFGKGRHAGFTRKSDLKSPARTAPGTWREVHAGGNAGTETQCGRFCHKSTAITRG